MKTRETMKLKKEFSNESWLQCINLVRLFIDEYNLELISINLYKKENYYVANLEYDLGVRK